MIVTFLAAARSRPAEKITLVDRPGGCRSYLQGSRGVCAWRTAVGATVCSVSAQRTRRQRPSNHHDPVMTSHLHGGNPRPVAKIRMAEWRTTE
jgi:hypothetical protein